MTWAGHIEWLRKRRATAAIWLFKKGLRAKQAQRARQASHEVLLEVRGVVVVVVVVAILALES